MSRRTGLSRTENGIQKVLVQAVQDYLQGHDTDTDLDTLLPELVGELQTVGWEDESLEEAIEILESPGDFDEFCDVLRGERYQREYCVPLPADQMPQPHLTVAGVDFYMEDCEEFTYLEDMIATDDRIKEMVEVSTQDTNFFAVFQITAPTQEMGEHWMETKLEQAIDAMNYSKDKGVIQSPFTQTQTGYFCRFPDGTYQTRFSNHPKYAFSHSFRTREEAIEFIEEGFDFLGSQEGDLTGLEKRFIQSYRWYGDGIQSGIPEDELLKYMVSMESMLIPETYGTKKHDLAERLADLRGIYEEYRDGFKEDVTTLYETRNTLVYSAEIDIPDIDHQVDSARRKATQMFGILLDNYIDECDDIQEVLTDLEERDVPEAPDDHNPRAPGN